MNATQLASRLANLHDAMKHAETQEWLDELHDAFRKTDIAFRAAMQSEMDAED